MWNIMECKRDIPDMFHLALRGYIHLETKKTLFLRIFSEDWFIYLLTNVLKFKRHIFEKVTVIFSCQNIEK